MIGSASPLNFSGNRSQYKEAYRYSRKQFARLSANPSNPPKNSAKPDTTEAQRAAKEARDASKTEMPPNLTERERLDWIKKNKRANNKANNLDRMA